MPKIEVIISQTIKKSVKGTGESLYENRSFGVLGLKWIFKKGLIGIFKGLIGSLILNE